jgi:thioredoxin 1
MQSRLCWDDEPAGYSLNKKGASTMNKFGKIAVVVVLAVAVVAVIAAKQGGSDSPSIQPSTQLASQPATQAIGTLPRLIDLGSTTCVPCKMMAPILEELKKQYAGRIQVEFINVNTDPDAAKSFGIDLIPTQVFLDASGKERWRHVGFISKEDIQAKFVELGMGKDSAASKASASIPASVPTTVAPVVKSGST